MNAPPDLTATTTARPAIVVERVLNASVSKGHDRLHLSLDENEGECHGYAVTICLPASYLSKVSKVRLQAA